jgi:hypothetical protein
VVVQVEAVLLLVLETHLQHLHHKETTVVLQAVLLVQVAVALVLLVKIQVVKVAVTVEMVLIIL